VGFCIHAVARSIEPAALTRLEHPMRIFKLLCFLPIVVCMLPVVLNGQDSTVKFSKDFRKAAIRSNDATRRLYTFDMRAAIESADASHLLSIMIELERGTRMRLQTTLFDDPPIQGHPSRMWSNRDVSRYPSDIHEILARH
jgi:hypothetical protein